MNLKQAVVFAILMENHEGIRGKHPNYIIEKLKICGKLEYPERLLDLSNRTKLKEWKENWNVEIDIEE